MGLLNTLLQVLRPVRLHDPVFGSLLFMRTPGGGYWEGKGVFRPAGHEVEWFIEARQSGPTQRDREFFQTLENRFPELMQQVEARIAESAAASGYAPPGPGTLTRMLCGIALPDLDHRPLTWELMFEEPGPPGRHVAASLRDWVVELVRVEV